MLGWPHWTTLGRTGKAHESDIAVPGRNRSKRKAAFQPFWPTWGKNISSQDGVRHASRATREPRRSVLVHEGTRNVLGVVLVTAQILKACTGAPMGAPPTASIPPPKSPSAQPHGQGNAPLAPPQNAMWIWNMSDRIVLDETERLALYSFLEGSAQSPSGPIRVLFLSLSSEHLLTEAEPIRAFLADAHSRGLEVHFLTGDPLWSLQERNPQTQEPYNAGSFEVLDAVLRFNQESPEAARFDGFQQDTEPYVLREDAGYPYSWSNPEHRTHIIWPQYIDTLEAWRARVNTHNQETHDDLQLGAAIPPWWDPENPRGTPADHRQVQDRTDYVAIMNYDIRSEPMMAGPQDELRYAEQSGLHRSVYVGFESLEVSQKEPTPESFFQTLYAHSSSYYYAVPNALRANIETLVLAHQHNPALKGLAYHYYEDLANGDTAYRSLTRHQARPPACLFHASTLSRTHPTSQLDIDYRAYDPDDEALSIDIAIMTEGEHQWRSVPTIDAGGHGVQINDGHYALDMQAMLLTTGTRYRVRIEATEKKPGGTTGYDISDGWLEIPAQASADIPPQSVSHWPHEPLLEGRRSRVAWPAFSMPPAPSVSLYELELVYTASTGASHTERLVTPRSYTHVVPPHPGTLALHVFGRTDTGQRIGPGTTVIEVAPDLDRDGIPDHQDLDLDGDGVGNNEEIAQDSNPHDPAAFPTNRVLGRWSMRDPGQLWKNEMALGPDLVLGGSAQAQIVTNPPELVGLWTQRGAHLATGEVLRAETTPINALSVELWLKPDGDAGRRPVPVFMYGDLDLGLCLLLNNEGGDLSWRLYQSPGQIFDSGPADSTLGRFLSVNVDNDVLFDGRWHRVTASYNGFSRVVRVSIDGRRVGQKMDPAIPKSLGQKRMRFFDSQSVYDRKNRNQTLIEQSALFESNLHRVPIEDGRFQVGYQGFVRDIVVTAADLTRSAGQD